jgi:hypothetical protein
VKRIDCRNFRVTFKGAVTLPFASGPLAGLASHVMVSGSVVPRPLGDIGVGTVPDERVSRDPAAAYRRRCEDIVELIREQYRGQVAAEILCDETAFCTLCGKPMEELTAEDLVEYADLLGPDEALGTPQCCDAAQAEWRTEQAGVLL